ncbi:hypothetical protein EVAR_46090_1 [Eumeta japonica]|uniref:Uncharacterized protein n=1 Tax=Eumeta variegata TaxID=151549 RepID=A0A4C1XDX8_EUMVA|nr:hypothetical protein EVAR_46090_1 [Eumeta japonica]
MSVHLNVSKLIVPKLSFRCCTSPGERKVQRPSPPLPIHHFSSPPLDALFPVMRPATHWRLFRGCEGSMAGLKFTVKALEYKTVIVYLRLVEQVVRNKAISSDHQLTVPSRLIVK